MGEPSQAIERRERALHIVEGLVQRYGSLNAAGRAFNERYGLRQHPQSGAGQRLIFRLRAGRTCRENSLDRLEVLLYG